MAVEVGFLILDPLRVRGTLCSSTEHSAKINKDFSADLAITSHRSVSVSGFIGLCSSRESYWTRRITSI